MPVKYYSDFFNDAKPMLAQENIQVVENSFLSTWFEQAIEEYWEMEAWPEIAERSIWAVDSNLNILYTSAGQNYYPTWNAFVQYQLGQMVYYSSNYYIVKGTPAVGDLPTDTASWIQYTAGFQGTVAIWDATLQYAAGIPVYYSGNYYMSINLTTVGDYPTDKANWQSVLIPTDSIRKIWLISEADPFNVQGSYNQSAYSTGYYGSTSIVIVEGQRIPGGVFLPSRNVGDILWVYYTPEYTSFSGAAWSSTATYTAGNVVYYDPTTNYYQVKTGASPSPGDLPTDTASWTALSINREIYPFVLNTAIANYLASLKNDRYQFYAARADTFMGDEKLRMARSTYSQPIQIIRTRSTERKNYY